MASTIMVVEDDPQARRLMEFLLNNVGFKVVWCEDGKQALARLERLVG